MMFYKLQQGLFYVPVVFYVYGYIFAFVLALKEFEYRPYLFLLVCCSLACKIGYYQLIGLWMNALGILFVFDYDGFCDRVFKGLFFSYFLIDLNSIFYHYTIGEFAPWFVFFSSVGSVLVLCFVFRCWVFASVFLFLGACLAF